MRKAQSAIPKAPGKPIGKGKVADGVRPVVRLPKTGMSKGVLIGLATVSSILLFSALEAKRRPPAQPAVGQTFSSDTKYASDPPPLQIPAVPTQVLPVAMVTAATLAGTTVPAHSPAASASLPPPIPPSPQTIRSYYDRANVASLPQPYVAAVQAPATPTAPRNSTGSPLVIDVGTQNAADAAPTSGSPTSASLSIAAGGGTARAHSSTLANRSMTVPQGTLIPAVLETAFDSTRPGFARAIVSQNVRGFDGAKVLIPRGSSLVGEYRSDTAPGQKRATITWTRLLRPDGITIALDSPAVDPLGRGGVRASVNNHVPERVLGAVLQSSFQIGTLLAARAASGSVVLALPSSLQGTVGQSASAPEIKPTLKVAAGTSISIFVARDLEFGGEAR